MAKKSIKLNKEYWYDEANLKGCTIWAHKAVLMDDNVSQKDLKELYNRGVKGIVKAN